MPAQPKALPQYDLPEPTFDEYVAARKVILYEYNLLRHEKFGGRLSIAHDEMVARVIVKSCERFRKGEVRSVLIANTHDAHAG